mmetsp:Transcript_14152/g.26478  ORF Transcript_14152/g.26478 Transcript_14152/m.26478 type:complete len:114 (+) Transcript_14152:23-364(+)
MYVHSIVWWVFQLPFRRILTCITALLLVVVVAVVVVATPVATIQAIVKASRWAVASMPRSLPTAATTWLPTAIGLGSIPLIIHPIDNGVDYLMENTFRKMTHINQDQSSGDSK